MRSKNTQLSPNAKRVLTHLKKSGKALTAYEILDQLRPHGIKAPPTVYRALETLQEHGLIHRIQSLSAFIACHYHRDDDHTAQFAICRDCSSVQEIHDSSITEFVRSLSKKLKFHVEREMLELYGLCRQCEKKAL